MKSTSFINKEQRNQKLLVIIAAVLTLAVPFFIMKQDTNGSIDSEQSLCPFKMLTGLPCPGCGITKSLISIYRLDLIKSFSYHLFGLFTFLFCIALIVTMGVELITQKSYFRQYLYNRKLAYTLGFALAVYHLSRLIVFVYSNSIDEIIRQSVWK